MTTNLPLTDDMETMFLCAVRYAIGRRTYITGVVTSYLAPLCVKLSTRTLLLMKTDIEDAAKTPGGLGMDVDERYWMRFLNDIRFELSERNVDA